LRSDGRTDAQKVQGLQGKVSDAGAASRSLIEPMARMVALSVCLVLSVAAAAPARSGISGCAPTLASQLASTAAATQLVTVVAPADPSTRAALQIWRKSDACWLAVSGPWPAWLGERGVSDHRHEGDRTTPAGAFGFGSVMYGVAPNPGVRYRYHRVVCGDWWVEDQRSPYYNRFHHVRCGTRPPFRVTDEDLSRSPTAYRHFAFIRYNTDPVVPGRGSGIFLHASTGRPTRGCVSLALPHLVTVLRWLTPSSAPLIVIGTSATIRRF
jgi:L,D-peptidoglycan transpeptidase YkuD (ErfK/YbiS/YcfS/YnhG family)